MNLKCFSVLVHSVIHRCHTHKVMQLILIMNHGPHTTMSIVKIKEIKNKTSEEKEDSYFCMVAQRTDFCVNDKRCQTVLTMLISYYYFCMVAQRTDFRVSDKRCQTVLTILPHPHPPLSLVSRFGLAVRR